MLLFATISPVQVHDGRLLLQHLDVCCHALTEFGISLKNASWVLDLLLSIKRVDSASRDQVASDDAA
jgi:hypothetical protein